MTIKMVREDGKTADVHPNMVEEYKKGGYVVTKEEPKPTRKPRAKKEA